MSDFVSKPVSPTPCNRVLLKWLPPRVRPAGRRTAPRAEVGDSGGGSGAMRRQAMPPTARVAVAAPTRRWHWASPEADAEFRQQLADIAGLDADAGLARVRGNAANFGALLPPLHRTAHAGCRSPAAALAANDIDAIARIAHSPVRSGNDRRHRARRTGCVARRPNPRQRSAGANRRRLRRLDEALADLLAQFRRLAGEYPSNASASARLFRCRGETG